jgi:hypothetical protein
MTRTTLGALVALLLACGVARAQDSTLAQSGQDLSALAKDSQNPIANLNTIPLQWNFYSGGGLGAQSMSILNVQPILPLPINANWLLVSRTVIPFVNIPGASGQRYQGIADIQEQFYFSPTGEAALIWGAGPIFSFPTSNQPATQTGQYAMGATAVALKIGKTWVYGVLANNLWKIGGSDGTTSINSFFVQPFVNYNLPGGWAISSVPAITANWSADSGQQWTVPVGLGFSKVTVVARIPMNVMLQYYGNAVRPDDAPTSVVRMQVNLMFPRGK